MKPKEHTEGSEFVGLGLLLLLVTLVLAAVGLLFFTPITFGYAIYFFIEAIRLHFKSPLAAKKP